MRDVAELTRGRVAEKERKDRCCAGRLPGMVVTILKHWKKPSKSQDLPNMIPYEWGKKTSKTYDFPTTIPFFWGEIHPFTSFFQHFWWPPGLNGELMERHSKKSMWAVEHALLGWRSWLHTRFSRDCFNMFAPKETFAHAQILHRIIKVSVTRGWMKTL